uniref:Uncharacterized protein n=1 Tax=Ficedula albicollis TaxID=59894 RepID=A0A803W5K1_FICAL
HRLPARSFPQHPAQAAHSNLLLPGTALHVWLGVPPAANLALQSLRGDNSSTEQQNSYNLKSLLKENSPGRESLEGDLAGRFGNHG